MSQKKKQSNSKMKNYVRLQIINVVVYLSLFLIFCAVSSSADVNRAYMPYVSIAFIGLASFMSGFIAGIKERKNGLICGLVNALPLNAVFFIFSLAFNGFKADIMFVISVISALVLSALGGIISVNVKLK